MIFHDSFTNYPCEGPTTNEYLQTIVVKRFHNTHGASPDLWEGGKSAGTLRQLRVKSIWVARAQEFPSIMRREWVARMQGLLSIMQREKWEGGHVSWGFVVTAYGQVTEPRGTKRFRAASQRLKGFCLARPKREAKQ